MRVSVHGVSAGPVAETADLFGPGTPLTFDRLDCKQCCRDQLEACGEFIWVLDDRSVPASSLGSQPGVTSARIV